MSSSENENGNENGNDKTMSSKEYDNETKNQNNGNIIKQLNDDLDKIIDESKSFEDQIKSMNNKRSKWILLGDKELEFKIFKPKLAHLSNIIGKKLFK